MAEAYKPYLDYLTSGNVAETAYIVAKNGAILATNLPIQAFPAYEFELEDENDPTKTNKIVVNEGQNFLEAMNNNGRAKHPAGLRLYNQKYYPVNYDAEEKHLYLKKVPHFPLRNMEAHVWPPPTSTTLSVPSTSKTKWKTESPRTPENSTRESKNWPPISRNKDIDCPPYAI